MLLLHGFNIVAKSSEMMFPTTVRLKNVLLLPKIFWILGNLAKL